jgi:CHAT domain-containing protein
MNSRPAHRTMIPVCGESLAFRIARCRHAAVITLTLACAVLASPAVRADDAAAARDRGRAAIDAFVDAFRRTGDPSGKLAELNAAAPALVAAANSFVARGDRANTAQTLIHLGDIHRMQARWEPALSVYRMAEAFAREIADNTLLAKALKAQAQVEESQRDYGKAREHATEAVRLSRGLPDKKLFGDALLVLGEIQIKLADFAGAADNINQAVTIADESGDDALRFYALDDRADIWMTMGFCDAVRPTENCLQQIDRALRDYAQAREAATRLGWTGLVSEIDGFIGRAQFQAQNVRSMLALNRVVGQLANQFKPKTARNVSVSETFVTANPEGATALRPVLEQLKLMNARAGGYSDVSAARSRFLDGLQHQMEGDFDTALASYRSALELFESDRGKLQDDTDRGGYFANKLTFYYRPIGVLLEKRNYAEAFDLFERSKARAMADLLASRALSFPTEQERRLYARLTEQRARVSGLQSNLFALLGQNRPESEIAREHADIADAERNYQATLAEMKGSAGKARELAVSQPASLAQLQAAMRNEGFETLMYLVDYSGLTLWHISADEVRVRNVFIPQRDLSEKVRALYDSLADRNAGFDAETARELYLFLVAPARSSIKSRRLVIIPNADLYQIPFEVLQNPEDSRFLYEEFELSYAPSATILLGMKPPRSPKDGRLLAVADPDLKAEVEAVATLYSGRTTMLAGPVPATKAEVTSRIGDYDVVHLSVHGEFNGRQPLLSHLKLTAGGGDDGRLTAAEMFGLPLDRANLVVLSACQTGMASVGNGDELVGMIRALLFAGARSFVLSRWKVDAASTSLWMRTFHAEAQSQPLGEAARRAIAAVRSNPAFADPHYWAPFMLVGR